MKAIIKITMLAVVVPLNRMRERKEKQERSLKEK
jgi:hypothetical protein